MFLEFFQGVIAVTCGDGAVSFAFKEGFDGVADVLFVIDDHDGFCHGLTCFFDQSSFCEFLKEKSLWSFLSISLLASSRGWGRKFYIVAFDKEGMLSPFIKKLMFARQFMIADGRIEVLGKRQVMLPFELLSDLQAIDQGKMYKIVKNDIHSTMDSFAKKIGASPMGMFKSLEEIFECFGLGKPEVIVLDQNKKAAVVRFHDTPLRNCSTAVVPGALAGMFSFLFNKQVECIYNKGSAGVCEFRIE